MKIKAFYIAVYILEKQPVNISKDTYLFVALLCISTMVHAWLAGSKRVLLNISTLE